MSGKIMLVGLGGLGKSIGLGLALEPVVDEIILASRNTSNGQAYRNLLRLTGAAAGRFPRVEFLPIDLNQVAEVAEGIAHYDPDLILSTATMMPWWLPDRLPTAESEKFQRAGFGIWLPVHLNLTVKFMQAVRMAEFTGPVLTAPFPDVVNPVLACLDLKPTCGIGNLAEIVPKIRLLAADKLDASTERVHVKMVAHHALEAFMFAAVSDPARQAAAPPYYLEIVYQGRPVNEEINADRIIFSAFPVPEGPESHALTASAAVDVIRALLSRQGALVHVPGPFGLPGGYPVVASQSGLSLALPSGLSLEEALAVNIASHKFDGIHQIMADGAVEFVPESAAIMQETLGYDCERLEPGEIEARAVELHQRFSAYAAGFGLAV
jgi:hypothetical protein